MNKDEFLEFVKDDFTKTGFFTGSRLSEVIDATGLAIGATINAGAGSNTIISTDGNVDKITAGNDGNTVELKTGTKVVTTGSGNDTINITGTGTRTIKAGAGNNTVNINNSSDFGNVTIFEQKLKAVNDVKFSNSIDNNYSLLKVGNDLSLTKDNASLTVKDYFSTNSKKATTTFFSNETELDLEALVSNVKEFVVSGKGTVTGTIHDNVVKTNDTALTGSASNDTVKAGKGNDIINAGRGKNSIYFYEGDGNDIVENGGGTDTLVFEKNTKVNVSLNNKTLTITYGNKGDTITINDYTDENNVKYIKIGSSKKALADYLPKPDKPSGSTNSPTDIPAGMKPSELSGNIKGTPGDDVLIGTTGNDSIRGMNGNDTIYGGAGNDVISGGGSNDLIYGGKGNDVLLGGGGHNTFYFAYGDGIDYINESGADNTLFFYGLNDVNNLSLYTSVDESNDTSLIITGYGSSYDKITIDKFISGDTTKRFDHSNYKLQAEGKDAVSLYQVVLASDGISNEIKEYISGFLSEGSENGGIAPQNAQTLSLMSSSVLSTAGVNQNSGQ